MLQIDERCVWLDIYALPSNFHSFQGAPPKLSQSYLVNFWGLQILIEFDQVLVQIIYCVININWIYSGVLKMTKHANLGCMHHVWT